MKVEVSRTNKRIIQLRYECGVIKVLAYRFASIKKIKNIINENLDWINEQRNRKYDEKSMRETHSISADNTQENVNNIVIRDFYLGQSTMILGDVYKIRSTSAAKTYFEGSALYINEKFADSKEMRLRAIKSYLKKISQLYVANEISQFGSSISVCPAKIEFKDIASDWIKCPLASQKILCLDYRIVQLPQELRQYLIAHAFTHFFEITHDINFWNTLSNYFPRYSSCKDELEKYDFLRDI